MPASSAIGTVVGLPLRSSGSIMTRLVDEVSLRQIIIAPVLPIVVSEKTCIGALEEIVWLAPAVFVGGIAAENTLVLWRLSKGADQTKFNPAAGQPRCGTRHRARNKDATGIQHRAPGRDAGHPDRVVESPGHSPVGTVPRHARGRVCLRRVIAGDREPRTVEFHPRRADTRSLGRNRCIAGSTEPPTS